MEFHYFTRVMLGIVSLWLVITFFSKGGFISGVGVGLSHRVSNMLVYTFLGVGGFFFGWGVGISSDMWTKL